MIIVDDDDFEAAIRAAFASDPETATKVIALMVAGCEYIEKFEKALAVARDECLAFTPDHDLALDEAHECFGAMIDIFGDILNIATGQIDADEA